MQDMVTSNQPTCTLAKHFGSGLYISLMWFSNFGY